MQRHKLDVVGIGVSTLDLLLLVDEFPADEVVLRAHRSILQGGGPVATAMVTLARLGARTAMVDKVGDDWRGKAIIHEFEEEGVATDFVAVASGRTSSIASVLVREKDGARTIVYAPGDAEELAPAEVVDIDVSPAKILHCNGRHLDASLALARQAKQQGVLVSFDGGAHRYKPELNAVMKLSDICIVAREYAFHFSNESDVEAAAAKMAEYGPKIVVVTAGSEGSWIFAEGEQAFHQPAFNPGTVVDTTGAGDAYHGAFLFGIALGFTLRDCAILASAVAAMNTRELGGRSALPSLGNAIAFISDVTGEPWHPHPS